MNGTHKKLTWLLAATCFSASVQVAAQTSDTARWKGLALGHVQLGGQAVLVVSAASERERTISLGKYTEMMTGEGVLHTYPASGKRCLLTRNIPVDLDAAYLNDENRVVEIGSLTASQPTAQCAQKPARRVLTVGKGQLAAYGLKVGDTVPAFTAVNAQTLAQASANVQAQRQQQRNQQAQQEAQDLRTPPRAAVKVGNTSLNPLLIFVHKNGGMDSKREGDKVPQEQGWLYVFETEVPAGSCRNPEKIHGELWEQLKYRQYAFERSGKLLGVHTREDGKLCAAGDGSMRYALVLPNQAETLTAGLELAPAMQRFARQRFDNSPALIPAIARHQYRCSNQTIESLFRVRDTAPDGSIQAQLHVLVIERQTDPLKVWQTQEKTGSLTHWKTQNKLLESWKASMQGIKSVADDQIFLLEHMQLDMQGVKDASGGYVFRPVRTLQASQKYQLQHFTDYGARTFDNVQAHIRGLPCANPAPTLTLQGTSAAGWEALVAQAQRNSKVAEERILQAQTLQQQKKLLARQQSRTEDLAGSAANFHKHYHLNIDKYQVDNARVSGEARDGISGWGNVFSLLLGGQLDITRYKAWAYQCSDRRYTITIRPKQDLDFPAASVEKYPVSMTMNWTLVQLFDNGQQQAQSANETVSLPVRREDSLVTTLNFTCVQEHYQSVAATEKGRDYLTTTEKQSALYLGDTSQEVVHHAKFTGNLDNQAISREYAKQAALLEEYVDRHNAEIERTRAWQNSPEGQAAQYRQEQDKANKKLLEAQKKALRDAQKEADKKAEEHRRKARDCEREKRANGGKARTVWTSC